MGISIFPSTAAEFVSNNFVVDMNDTTNNTADTGGVKQAGPYSISFSSGDSSFDVYLIDNDGNSVGYSNNTSIVASGLFTTVVILGVAQDEVVSFLYQGSVNNADGEGDEPGAGAYLTSISPSDLPSIDDTATVTGGNFASDVEITFESGATVLSAKNIVRNSSTELVVTRPDALVEDDSPYTLKAVNPGITPPTGSNSHILTDAVTAGSDPTWVTNATLTTATINAAYTETLEATDADGTVVDYSVTTGSLPTGLSLDSTTGVISGTPTDGSQTFTVTATDDGGNSTPKEFTLPVQLATGGTVTTDSQYFYHTFTSTDDFIAAASIPNAEVLVIAGGGGSPDAIAEGTGGGAGAGGLAIASQTISAGTHTATVGAGGNSSNGSNSSLGSIFTAIGGGRGGPTSGGGGTNGGSGGGNSCAKNQAPAGTGGSGTSGQGTDGGTATGGGRVGGGGGKTVAGSNDGIGGQGIELADWASATSTGDNGFYAGGGGGQSNYEARSGGAGGGGDAGANVPGSTASTPGQANTGGGGPGAGRNNFYSGGGANTTAPNGGSGLIIVRYAI